MRLAGIQIVEIGRLGRGFHALVDANASGGLAIEALDRRISYGSYRVHDFVAHWLEREIGR